MNHNISTEIDLGPRDHSEDDIIFCRSWGCSFKSNALSYSRFEAFKDERLGVRRLGNGVQPDHILSSVMIFPIDSYLRPTRVVQECGRKSV